MILENNFIAPRLQGRTGNMMFQIANSYSKSLEYGRQLVIPIREGAVSPYMENIFRGLNFCDINYNEIKKFKSIDSPFHYTNLDVPSEDSPTRYCGWFQSEKFFYKHKKEIIKNFGPTESFVDETLKEFPSLNDNNTCVINVRRGDYLLQPTRHPVITLEYIEEALKLISDCENYLVLSDDIEWCRKNIKIKNVKFVENYWDWRGLWLMSLCNNFIISNSSYSWWGAFLSTKTNKKVIAPSLWVGPDIVDNMEDVWCENWIKIPTKYNEGKLILNL